MSSQPTILCFEDAAVQRLAPVVTARPAYAISCASHRLIDWLRHLNLPILADCRPHLRAIQKLDFSIDQAPTASPMPCPTLFVNARLVPSPRIFKLLSEIVRNAQPIVIRDGEGTVAVAYLATPDATDAADSVPITTDAGTFSAVSTTEPMQWSPALEQRIARLAASLPASDRIAETFKWPNDIVYHHMRTMDEAMQWRITNGQYTQLQDGVFVSEGAMIGQYPVIDTSKGPIIIERDVKVGPFCFLAGPVHIGAGSRIIEHSALKDAVALGHTTKVGGEVEASVIEPFTNKQHHGFLGHSYLGSWINLGAGTCNSDLKNTYGTINMDYGTDKVATEMQFMGCIMGDYSKTAINTGIFTGKVIGVCSMLYGFVTSNVPSFVNYARLFGQTATLPPEVMISTQARMFARRKVQQRECDQQLIFDMFDLTEEERNLQAAIGL
ncbi:MAG TPA: glucose-1-phosphate thymidylyltransferase [Planctomycetaceae bacterium]|nr:glucose-1-phosphate thymidylyltransferase [Planctomycetaceae bacterium]